MGTTLAKGVTFASGQSVTHLDLNNLVDDGTIQAGGVVDTHLNTTADNGVITGQTADTDPDVEDLLLVHDASLTSLRKVTVSSLSRFLADPKTVSELNALDNSDRKEGSIAYCTNGNAGAKCLAVYDGTNWKAVALGSTIATS